MPLLVMILAAGLVAGAALAYAADNFASLRGPAPLTEEGEPPPLAPEENRDLRRVRNYPEQPPTIPHKIEGYQIDINANRCLSCHSRTATGESQAPMVSITHFMDRDGQFLAAVSPRRYFCTQCHIPQHEVDAPLENTFEDIDSILTRIEEGRTE
ncbi:MAG TPA: nitrate reductase cytochrome c-type subunit [Kofleriaceae bacterium]|nr:nitrate reductase cytochrome c-type subunit [Kofleriaceae bacterium]